MKRGLLLASFALLGIGGLIACDSGDKKASGPSIQVESVWGRPSPMMADTGAVYMVIQNTGGEADRLIAAETDVCEVVELHESVMDGDVMHMRPVAGGGIEIPAGGSAELKPGGYHVMLIRLKSPLEAGASVPLTLVFEKSGKIKVDAEMRE